MLLERSPELHESGEHLAEDPSVGSMSCTECGYSISIEAVDDVPECPACGGTTFKRARLFDQSTIDVGVVEAPSGEPDWLDEVRASARGGARHLAVDRGRGPETIELEEGWTRIGRSGSATIKLDDPTVSRRHALVVRTPEGNLRALDDRSLNGLFVNGEKVEWAELADGDELEVGRYRLFVLAG